MAVSAGDIGLAVGGRFDIVDPVAVSHEGMVSVGGNLYSVPDATRGRVVEVHTLAHEVRIFKYGVLLAAHPVLEGRNQRWVAPGYR